MIFLLTFFGCPQPTPTNSETEKKTQTICVKNKVGEPVCYEAPRDEYVPPAGTKKSLY